MTTPVKTALCSFGMSGLVFHSPFLSVNPDYTFYAVCERTKNKAAEKFPNVITYRSIEEMLADELIELVIVNTPSYTHYEYAKKALEARKHVIVEKPFTTNTKEAEELIALAKKQNKILSIYQNRRYDSDYKTVKKVLDKKLLGDLIEAEIHYDRFKAELSPKKHKETPGRGVGVVYDLGSHIIDQALQLFGMPEKIFADIRIIRPLSKVDDYFELLLYYPKLRVRLKSSYLAREVLPAYIFHGLKGSFIKTKSDIQESMLESGNMPGGKNWGTEPESDKGLLHTEIDGIIVREYITSEQGNYGDYYHGIYEAIRNNKPVPVTAEEGEKVIKMIETAFESSRTRKVIEI